MKSIILTMPLILLFAVSAANAQPGPLWQAEELNLSEAQQQKLDDLQFQHQKAMIQKQADLKEAKLEMKNLMQKAEIDEKTVLEKHKRISALKAEISEAKLKHHLEMRKALTKDQLDKLIKIERDRERMGKPHREGDRRHKSGGRGCCMGPAGGPVPEKQPE